MLAPLLVVALALAGPDLRVLCLRSGHDGSTLCLRPFGPGGHVAPSAAARLAHFLRSRRSGQRHRVHPQLVRDLVQVQRHFRAPQLDVFSVYRAPSDPNGPHGYHGLGRAADLRVPTATARDVFDYCRRSLRSSGCGLYPNRAFVHIDARPHTALWVDLSTGAGSYYVKGVYAWLDAHPDAGRGRPSQPYREGGGRAFQVPRALLITTRRGEEP
jgi:uncharacterized protein YcbK (DUF882 family)